MWKPWQIFFSWAPKSLRMVTAAMTLEDTCSLERKLWQHILKSRDFTLLTKVHLVKSMVFEKSCMDVRVGPPRRLSTKNWAFWTVVLEKTLASPLDNREIQPVNPKGNQPWIFIGRTDAEAEAPVVWPPYVKSQLIENHPDVGKDWGQEEKGATEDDMVGWHH